MSISPELSGWNIEVMQADEDESAKFLKEASQERKSP
jgi:hypothetical protein